MAAKTVSIGLITMYSGRAVTLLQNNIFGYDVYIYNLANIL